MILVHFTCRTCIQRPFAWVFCTKEGGDPHGVDRSCPRLEVGVRETPTRPLGIFIVSEGSCNHGTRDGANWTQCGTGLCVHREQQQSRRRGTRIIRNNAEPTRGRIALLARSDRLDNSGGRRSGQRQEKISPPSHRRKRHAMLGDSPRPLPLTRQLKLDPSCLGAS